MLVVLLVHALAVGGRLSPAGGGYIRFMYRVALHLDYPETKGCLGHFLFLPVQEAMSL